MNDPPTFLLLIILPRGTGTATGLELPPLLLPVVCRSVEMERGLNGMQISLHINTKCHKLHFTRTRSTTIQLLQQ